MGTEGRKLMEYLDIVDENGSPTGETVERAYAHKNGISHRTAHVWILRKRADEIQVLLQKRAETKSFPGCFDISSAGHITAGQDYLESAVRELHEELGITAAESDLVYCGDRRIVWDDVFFGEEYHDRQFTKVFLLWADVEESDLVLQEEEVSSVRWMGLDECIKGVRENAFKNCIYPEELEMVKRKAVEEKKLAVVFPGMGYHSDKPLLYYSKKLAKARGYEVVEISYDFQKRAKDIMNDKEGKHDAFLHAVGEAKKQLLAVNYADFTDIVFIGKSIGTTVAAYFDKENGINARHVVFTPVPDTFKYLRDNCGIVFHGTADPWCETKLAESRCEELHLELVKVADANHSLETDDPITDCGRMPGILDKVNEMLV